MDMSNLHDQFADVVFRHYNVSYLTDILNSATMNDLSNIELNEDEQIAYNNIINSRQVVKELDGSTIKVDVDYEHINDPGDFLPIALEGQDAPEITGTVHLPQGGTRKSNVKFWYPGQVYEEGAKDPVLFPENDKAILKNFSQAEADNAAAEGRSEFAEIVTPYITNNITGGNAL